MFRRVLVANRGEIARRIIRTLNRMRIESVAIYSEADSNAGYLREATMSVCIGPAPAQASYLCADALLEAALRFRCEALHPGFGFLAENAIFAARCDQQKLTFIGPTPALIAMMGDKARARSVMGQLSVPTLKGSDGIIGDVDAALSLAQDIGYPVLLKARAGGGGKGMRLVRKEADLATAFSEARREAESAFGDGELYIEKFIEGARHIEFQVLADSFGNVLCLGDRECSVQRRNQKLIEEAPASSLGDDARALAIDVIRQAIKALGYTNAGTLEFLLADQKLYFMEMNTRIQVEHPVTEMVTGLDIVEWQIRIACNERLVDEHIPLKGAAIECRINAENPTDGFKPSPGVISELSLPPSSDSVRIDTHIDPGFVVTPFYDSLLAKVIVHGHSRREALALMIETLDKIRIVGVNTNLDLQRAIMKSDALVKGDYDCSFLEKNLQTLLDGEAGHAQAIL